MKTSLVVCTLLIFWMTGCNLPIQTNNPALATPGSGTPSGTFTTPTMVPVETLLARATPTFVSPATRTPRLALASPRDQPVNCRFGPSIAYAVVGILDVGKQAELVGKNIDITWWYVRNPSDPSTFCWLLADLIDATGNIDPLPVFQASPAQVTDIQIRVDPPSLNVACTAFPQYVTVNADIITNGPATVTWRWETSEGEIMEGGSLLYLETGSQGDFVYYKVNAARDYWIQVHILSPNDTTGRATFKATCTP